MTFTNLLTLPRVHPQLPTGSWGPGSFTLISLLGCLPGPVCGVREKRASDALSLLVLFLLVFLLSTVFAQTQDALPQEAEPDKVLLYLLDSRKQWIFESTLRHSPPPEKSKKFTYAQVCARDLTRAQWPWNCHDATVDKLDPSLPTVCYCFTDISSLGLSDEDFATEIGFLNFVYGARIPPFHFLMLACEGFAPSTPSLSASPGWSLPSTLCVCVVGLRVLFLKFLA